MTVTSSWDCVPFCPSSSVILTMISRAKDTSFCFVLPFVLSVRSIALSFCSFTVWALSIVYVTCWFAVTINLALDSLEASTLFLLFLQYLDPYNAFKATFMLPGTQFKFFIWHRSDMYYECVNRGIKHMELDILRSISGLNHMWKWISY